MGVSKTQVKLRAFQVSQAVDIRVHPADIVELFSAKYDQTNVQDRMRIINEEDKEYELLPFLIKDQDTLFGAILRLEVDSKSPLISSELFKKKNFRLNELSLESKKTNIYKGHYYFCFNNKKLVTNLPGNTNIFGLQTYINWFLSSATTPYELSPLIKSVKDTKLSDIQEVVFEDNSIMLSSNNKSITATEDIQENKLIDIDVNLVKRLLNDTPNLTEEELRSVISARLLLTFNKPKKMSDEQYQSKFSAMLKPVSNLESIHYVTRNKERITADKILETTSRLIEKTQNGFLDEEQLRQAMLIYLNGV